MPALINLISKKFNSLTVISRDGSTKDHHATWNCICDCGNLHIASGQNLKRGSVKSCGCLGNEHHGMWNTPEYRSWQQMKDRCYNPNNRKYRIYGERGITVCDEWAHSFSAFYTDMGTRPNNTSIDRINGNGNYELGNCRWATIIEQNNNTSQNHLITVNGVTKNITQWADYLGVKRQRIYDKIRYGRTDTAAILECIES